MFNIKIKNVNKVKNENINKYLLDTLVYNIKRYNR